MVSGSTKLLSISKSRRPSPTRFTVDQEDHVRPLEDGRHLISDSHGMRYLVPVPSALDVASRKLLARFS